MDLICIRCHSTYEIKSKNCQSKIEQVVRRGVATGSFENYCKMRNCRRSGEKMYVVVVGRRPELDREHTQSVKRHHPVFIAEIEDVSPRCCVETFNGLLAHSESVENKRDEHCE